MICTPSIRKAAILVSLLDARQADALLEPMGEELAAQVRQAVMDLDDVTPAEEEQVLAEFFGQGEGRNDESAVEIELSRPLASGAAADLPADRLAPPNFEFLADIPPAAVAEVLAREQPQTIAVVVAHIAPQTAGQVLEQLPSALAIEALARMARLLPPAPEVLADLEAELRRRLAPYGRSASPAGSLAGVEAILASLPRQSRSQWLARLAEHDQQLACRLDASGPDRPPPDHGSEVTSFKYRLESEAPRPLAGRPAAASPPLIEFEDLAQLSQSDLARFATVANRQLLALALVDADPRLAQRIAALLPVADAAELRGRLAEPGPLRLKEIDEAQRQLAELARDLASRGEINLPTSRHFAAAA